MALGANFSLQADSHLVCMQNEQGYKTQAINIQNQARKGTLPMVLRLFMFFFLFFFFLFYTWSKLTNKQFLLFSSSEPSLHISFCYYWKQPFTPARARIWTSVGHNCTCLAMFALEVLQNCPFDYVLLLLLFSDWSKLYCIQWSTETQQSIHGQSQHCRRSCCLFLPCQS